MIELIKAKWAETSTKIGVVLIVAMWGAALAVAYFQPDRWPTVKEALEWPFTLLTSGALAAIVWRDKQG